VPSISRLIDLLALSDLEAAPPHIFGVGHHAITPDGTTLVGIMQSALDNPFEDRTNIRSRSRVTRILTFDLASGATKQYIYLQEIPNLANSEIIALSKTEFHVLERDGNFPGNASAPAVYKRVYKINLNGATDVSDPADAEAGKLVNGKTLEQSATRRRRDSSRDSSTSFV